jgi:uncharacterized coiled-coil DUF342 family protein
LFLTCCGSVFFQINDLENELRGKATGICVQCKAWERKVDHLIKQVTQLKKLEETNKKLEEELSIYAVQLKQTRKELELRKQTLSEKMNKIHNNLDDFSSFTKEVKKDIDIIKKT